MASIIYLLFSPVTTSSPYVLSSKDATEHDKNGYYDHGGARHLASKQRTSLATAK